MLFEASLWWLNFDRHLLKLWTMRIVIIGVLLLIRLLFDLNVWLQEAHGICRIFRLLIKGRLHGGLDAQGNMLGQKLGQWEQLGTVSTLKVAHLEGQLKV